MRTTREPSSGATDVTNGVEWHLTRKCGLAIENLIEADVVLADARFVTASAEEHPDLFWALRGGGGNFGVVTSFVLRLHPIDTVYAGPMSWPIELATENMPWYREFITQAPDDINGLFAFHTVPAGEPFPEHLHGQKICAIVWCYKGALDGAEAVFALIRAKFGPPLLDWVGPIPHPALQGMFDGLDPPIPRVHWMVRMSFPGQALERRVGVWRAFAPRRQWLTIHVSA